MRSSNFSGSPNYIFNNYNLNTTFKNIEKAQKEGYTEPDPKIDLSGVDGKKILILVGSGFNLELNDITNNSFSRRSIKK